MGIALISSFAARAAGRGRLADPPRGAQQGRVQPPRLLLRPRPRARQEGRRQGEPQREPPQAAGDRQRAGQ